MYDVTRHYRGRPWRYLLEERIAIARAFVDGWKACVIMTVLIRGLKGAYYIVSYARHVNCLFQDEHYRTLPYSNAANPTMDPISNTYAVFPIPHSSGLLLKKITHLLHPLRINLHQFLNSLGHILLFQLLLFLELTLLLCSFIAFFVVFSLV